MTLKNRVMIVDDATFMRTVLKNILTQNGFDVVGEADDGRKAIALYDVIMPDFVTMDITMPEMSGIEAVKEIVAKHKEAKIMMCSAMGQQAMVIEALQAGAKDFIIKPFEAERVVASLRKLQES